MTFRNTDRMKNMVESRTSGFAQYRILTDLLNQGEENYHDLPSVISTNKINYKDLVFTLKKNPEQYVRPIVELENYGFFVRGNNAFFKAGKEAGLKSFICNVNAKTLEDKHFSQFQLMDPDMPESDFSVHAVLFLDFLRGDMTEDKVYRELEYRTKISGVPLPKIDIKLHPINEAIEYKISKKNVKPSRSGYLFDNGDICVDRYLQFRNRGQLYNELPERNSAKKDNDELIVSFLQVIAMKYGKIRSINGILPY